MKSKLSTKNMDLVMKVVRDHNVSFTNVMDFLLDNPELIAITRGELNEENYKKRSKTYKK